MECSILFSQIKEHFIHLLDQLYFLKNRYCINIFIFKNIEIERKYFKNKDKRIKYTNLNYKNICKIIVALKNYKLHQIY